MSESSLSHHQRFAALRRHIQQRIIGQSKLIERLIIGIIADGHLLIEGLPGLAKTTAVHTLASGMSLSFQRIQFTPDLIPGDITGGDIFLAQQGEFKFIEGPIFNQIILADEINRAPPKVQSALLEAMQERQVTHSGISRPLADIFIVVATQNPLDHEGTYTLPEAQLDRFVMKIQLDYPKMEDELSILRHETQRLQSPNNETIKPILDQQTVIEARKSVNNVFMSELLERYIVALVGATRQPDKYWPEAQSWVNHGASPRATLALARCARALAFIRQRDFVEPADIRDIAFDVLNHRIGLSFNARADKVQIKDFIAGLLQRIPVP